MFTSSGYFRGLNCPYFMSGLCERTYCHFRHSKPALEKESLQRSLSKDAGETSVPASYGGPSSSLSVTIDSDDQYTTATTSTEESGSPECSSEKSAEDESTKKEDGCKIGPYGKYWPTQQYEPVSENSGSSAGVHYTPTPISALENKSPPKEEKIVITHAKGGAMLEYNPTPIVQLQQMRRRPSHRLRGKSAEGMEYDPESNFSTVGKPVKEDGGSRKRTHCEDLSPVEYVPTKRNHLDQEAEFSDNEDIENVHVEAYEPDGAEENLPEYIPTSKTSSKYPVDSSDIDNKNGSSLATEDEKKEENRPKTPVPDSRLSMDDYLKLLLNPTKPSQSLDTASKKFELKKKSKDSNSNSAREKSTKVDQNSSMKKKKNDSSNSVSSKTSKDSKSDSSSKNSSSKYCKDSNRKDADVKGIGKDGKLSDGQRRSSKENDSSKSHKRNGESHSSRSSSSHSSKHRSSQSHSHRSSSSKEKASSESSAKSDSSKHHSSSQKGHSTSHKSESTSGEKVRHSSSDKAKSRHSQKTEKSSDTVVTNGHSGKESDSKNSMKRSISQSETGTPKQKKPLHVNLDLFGHDSDISDDNSVRRANFDGGEDRDSDDTFRGDNLDSDLETTLDMSDLDEDVDTYEECLRIFNETKHHVKLPNVGKSAKKEPQEEKASLGKKRVAHSLDVKPVKKIMERPMSKLSPAQVMHNRFVQMQKRALEAAKANHSSQEASTSGTGSKSRVSHGASLAARSKEKLTIATASKTEKRQAHVPVVASLPRPTVPADFGSKIPTNVRQRYLNLMIDECLKLCKTEKEAYDRALEEEQACYNRASSKNIYLNVSVNAIKKLRVEITNKKNKTPSKADSATTLSHEAMLGGLKATQISYTLNRSQGAPKAQTADFLGAELYRRLESYILAEDQLVENGFPRWDPDNPGTPTIQERNFGQTSPKKAISKVNQKLCVRCGKRFEVFPNGKYAVKEECVYHWGKAWKRKIAGAIETRYTCCSSELDVKGCQVCPLHVYDSNKYDNLSGFMRTLPSSPPIDGDYGTYAMDCEMVYTHGGCELARVTVIAPDYSAIYESLVKPDKPVIDYNTRFSGITAEDLKGVTTSLRDVQAILLSLLTDRTILLGHSLESDLIATKLIHSTVVDTSVVFPHRLGPPYKRALKTLMGEYLQKIIQDDVGGHDSHEDAASCLELMQLKLKQDAKKQVRRN